MHDIEKTVAIAADHAGFELKTQVAAFLKSSGYEVIDLGAHSPAPVDYPEYGFALASAVADGKARFGVGICGSGVGMSIALNRNPKIRAALCHDITSARLARQHNDANVIALGARLMHPMMALETLRVFLETPFEGGRHETRVAKLGQCT